MSAALSRHRPAAVAAAEPELALAESIHGLMRGVLHKVQPTLEREGLSMGRFWFLHLISDMPDPTLTTVARLMAVKNASACGVIDGLVRTGLVERRRSETDRRVVELVPTAAGRRAQAAVWRAIGNALRAATDSLDPEDLRTTARTLATVTAEIGDGPAATLRGRNA